MVLMVILRVEWYGGEVTGYWLNICGREKNMSKMGGSSVIIIETESNSNNAHDTYNVHTSMSKTTREIHHAFWFRSNSI